MRAFLQGMSKIALYEYRPWLWNFVANRNGVNRNGVSHEAER
jgi:LAS superfamily LD-carboxypeptidase LdcB